jgi:hypothetical protein
MRAALICSNVDLGFVVLNALAANGIRPLLLCDRAAAREFRSSRLTSGVVFAGHLSHQQDMVARTINECHRREPVDIVLASDVAGLICIHNIREHLLPPVYPMPGRDALDTLNDKWKFFRLVSALGLSTPRTLFFSSRQAIDPRIVEREIGFPAVIKPIDSWSAIGVRIVASRRDVDTFLLDRSYTFERVVVQQFIPGRDVGLGTFARHGEPAAISTFLCGPRDATECVDLPEFASMATAIMRQTDYCGVANFDGRMSGDGRIWLLECNPRFFMRLRALRICGLDFIRFGLPGMEPSGGKARGSYYSRRDLVSIGGIARVLSGRWPVGALLRDFGDAIRDPWPLLLRGVRSGPV